MSDLQLGLIALGVLVVAGIYLYNRIQERRFRREAGSGLKADYEDVLLGEPAPVARMEPSIAADAVGDESGTRRVESPDTQPASVADPFDPDIQFVVGVRAPLISPEAIAAAMAAAAQLGRPVAWYGRDGSGAAWTALHHGQVNPCEDVAAAVLLADRSGPVSAEQLQSLVRTLEDLAHACGGAVDGPEPVAAAEAAVRLDAFCADVDVQVGVNLVAPGEQPLAATRVRGLAEASGFRLDGDGLLRYTDDTGRVLFAMCNRAPEPLLPDRVKHMQLQGVTLLLDVPRAADGLAAFDRMVQVGRSLAASLGWTLVDDRQAPLDDGALGKIRASLASIYARMEVEGIPAGGERALRLFS